MSDSRSCPRAALIIPFFGSWPSFFPLFLKGCAANPWLHILFFTNCPIPTDYPLNVKFHAYTLEDVARLASTKLSFDVRIASPYKLCDLKPLYGIIFGDYLEGYDYWGYGDIDLIYGDMAPFYLPLMNSGIDAISSREPIFNGSFSLLRNSIEVKNLGLKIPELPSLINNPTHLALDETCGSGITWNGASKLDLPRQSLTYLIAAGVEEGTLTASFENRCREHLFKNEVIHYTYPRLTVDEKEVAYFHYVTNKGRNGFHIPFLSAPPDRFYFTETGYYSEGSFRYHSLIAGWRKTRGFVRSYYRRALGKLKRLVGTNQSS